MFNFAPFGGSLRLLLHDHNPLLGRKWIFLQGWEDKYISSGTRKGQNRLLTGAKRREWMGCWGLLGWLLLVIMDHSRKFPAFSTSKFILQSEWPPECRGAAKTRGRPSAHWRHLGWLLAVNFCGTPLGLVSWDLMVILMGLKRFLNGDLTGI